MSLRTGSLCVVTAAAIALGAPAAASAVTGTIGKPCHANVPGLGGTSQPIVITLTGGAPNGNFVVSAAAPGKAQGSSGSASGKYDAAGNAVTQIENVSVPGGGTGPTKGRPVIITVSEFASGSQVDTAIGQTLITNLAMSVASRPVNPRKARRVSVSGTAFAGKKLYGFIVKGTNPKVLRRFSLGTGNECGFASASRVVAPRSFRRGTYRLYVNAGTKLNKDLALAFTFEITRRLV
ncbi:MAG TPA: hypothetical protein VMY78_07690 [Solirubrobacteraceae bacterium]|nr:hypothetical protein [Solirubrobacteraceae bacterium]